MRQTTDSFRPMQSKPSLGREPDWV
jgi:hypothetical protein